MKHLLTRMSLFLAEAACFTPSIYKRTVGDSLKAYGMPMPETHRTIRKLIKASH